MRGPAGLGRGDQKRWYRKGHWLKMREKRDAGTSRRRQYYADDAGGPESWKKS